MRSENNSERIAHDIRFSIARMENDKEKNSPFRIFSMDNGYGMKYVVVQSDRKIDQTRFKLIATISLEENHYCMLLSESDANLRISRSDGDEVAANMFAFFLTTGKRSCTIFHA